MLNTVIDAFKYGAVVFVYEVIALIIATYNIKLDNEPDIKEKPTAISTIGRVFFRFYILNVIGLFVLNYI